jgi:hypothetical protein
VSAVASSIVSNSAVVVSSARNKKCSCSSLFQEVQLYCCLLYSRHQCNYSARAVYSMSMKSKLEDDAVQACATTASTTTTVVLSEWENDEMDDHEEESLLSSTTTTRPSNEYVLVRWLSLSKTTVCC